MLFASGENDGTGNGGYKNKGGGDIDMMFRALIKTIYSGKAYSLLGPSDSRITATACFLMRAWSDE